MTLSPSDFGSVQYQPVVDLYREFFEKKEREGRGDTHETFLLMGFEVSFDKVRPFEEAKKFLKHDMLDEVVGDPVFDEGKTLAADWEKIKDAEGFFDFTRSLAWDLWSAAPFIAEAYFENLHAEEKKELHGDLLEEASKGWPIINQLIIGGETATTAIACILLKDFGIIEDEAAFADFST